MTLIVLGVVQHGFEKRLLYLMQHYVIELTTGFPVEGLKEVADRFAGAVSQRWRACRGFLATLGGSAVYGWLQAATAIGERIGGDI